MSDGSDPQNTTLTTKVREWVVEVYHALGWALTATGPQPEDTAADALLATLRNPRPDDLTAPGDATEGERNAIDTAYDDVIGQLERHGFNPDLGDAPNKVDLIRKMVAAVPLRVAKDQQRREELRKTLGALAPPDGVLPEEAEAFSLDVKTLLGKLDDATDLEFDGLEKSAGLLAIRQDDLGKAVERRTKAAQALLDKLADCTAPDDCLPDEGTAITDRARDLQDALVAPCSDGVISDLTPKVETLVSDRDLLVQKVATRAQAAQAIIDRLAKCTAPADCLVAEGKDIEDRAQSLRDGLKKPYDDTALQVAEAATTTLEQDRALLEGVVLAREVRAQKILFDLGAVKVPTGANTAETDEISTVVKDAMAPVVQPYGDGMLDDAEKALTTIGLRVVAIGLAVSDREVRRKDLSDRLALLVCAPGTTADEKAAFAKSRIACKSAVAGANDDVALGNAEGLIDKLEKNTAAQALFVAAREVGQKAIDAARQTLQTEGPAIDQTYQTALRTAILTATEALSKATKTGDVDTLVKKLGETTAKLADAKAYSAERDLWLTRTAFYVASANDPKVTAARDTAQGNADGLALAGDYPGARAALDDFATDGDVNKADLDAAEAYRQRLAGFQAATRDLLAVIRKSKIPGVDLIDQGIAAARTAAATGDYTEAIRQLNLTEPKIVALHKIVDTWRTLSAMVTNAMLPNDPVRLAVAQANTELANGMRGAAQSTLSSVPPGTRDLAAARLRHQRLNGLTGMLGSGPNPHKAWAKALLPAANTIVAGIDLVALKGTLDTVEARITAVRDWMEADARVRPLQATHDPTGGLALLAGADGDALANNYGAAVAKLNTAEGVLRLVGEFRMLETQVARLVAAQANGTAGHTLADTALTEARVLLNTDKKPADAIARLKLALADPDQADLAATDALWTARLKATTARQTRVIRLLTDPARPEPTTELTQKFEAARDKGEVDHDYEAATALLDAHDTLLDKAGPLASARQQMINLRAALARAEAAFPGDINDIYEGKPKDEIDTEMADADDLARNLDFVGATSAYKTLIGLCRKLALNTAKLYENADKAGTNAGHSLDRHGPDITDTQLLTRLQTGLAPDGKMSFCSASSRFDDPQAWLAAREKALAEAVAPPPDGGGKNLAQTSYPANVADKDLKHEAIIDHGGPIDRAFRGVKKNRGVQPDGSVGDLQSYETYEELKGITKSKTLVLFVIDPPPDGNPKNPKTVSAYKERFKAMNDALNKVVPAPVPLLPLVPPDIPGRWVVMQHFPVVEGWDQEKGDYV